MRLLVSDTEALGLLDAAQRQAAPRDVAFSTALVSALLYTGVRADELVHVKVEDVSIERGEFLVTKGKGGKVRTLYPAPEFFAALKAWLHEREKIGCEHSWLWAQGPRRGMSYERLLAHLEELKAIAGYKGARNIKPHSLRHWFATNLYRQMKNIKIVQRALGHAHPQTTYTYLHLDEEECRAMSTMTLGKPVAAKSSGQAYEAEQPKPSANGNTPPVPARGASRNRQSYTRVRRDSRRVPTSR